MEEKTPARQPGDVTGRLKAWAREGLESSLPGWQELPAIPLYMDQVIFYLGDCLRLFQEEGGGLTSSMINNYVKNGVLPHPEKKKYSREHLAALMAVCLLKPVLSLQDIKSLLGERAADGESYEFFRQANQAAVAEACRALEESCDAAGEDPEALRREAMRLGLRANALRAASRKLLDELGRDGK